MKGTNLLYDLPERLMQIIDKLPETAMGAQFVEFVFEGEPPVRAWVWSGQKAQLPYPILFENVVDVRIVSG